MSLKITIKKEFDDCFFIKREIQEYNGIDTYELPKINGIKSELPQLNEIKSEIIEDKPFKPKETAKLPIIMKPEPPITIKTEINDEYMDVDGCDILDTYELPKIIKPEPPSAIKVEPEIVGEFVDINELVTEPPRVELYDDFPLAVRQEENNERIFYNLLETKSTPDALEESQPMKDTSSHFRTELVQDSQTINLPDPGVLKHSLSNSSSQHVGENYKCFICSFTETELPKIFLHYKTCHKETSLECKFCNFIGLPNLLEKHVKNEHKYICFYCEQTWNKKKELKNHILNNHPQYSMVFQCNHCDVKFHDKSVLEKHTSSVHMHSKGGFEHDTYELPKIIKPEPPSTIKVEPETVGEFVDLNELDISPSSTTNINCATEKERILLEDNIEENGSEDQVGNSLNANVNNIDQLLINKSDLKNSREGNYYCCFCEFCTLDESEAAGHMKSHNFEGLQDCPNSLIGICKYFNKMCNCCTCDFKAQYKSRVKKHIWACHLWCVSKILKCDLCDFRGVFKSEVKIHMRDKHVKPYLYKCNLCDFTSSYPASVNSHHRRQHLPKQKCQHCDYSTNDKFKMKMHVKSIHFKIKDEKCPYCDFKTSRRRCVKSHIKLVHLNIKPEKRTFICYYCNKSFRRKSHLKSHILSNHFNVRFKCKYCSKKFKTSSSLWSHIRLVHNENKKYFYCDECDYKSARKDYVALHKSSCHSDIKPYACPHCPHRSARNDNLKVHIRRVHQ